MRARRDRIRALGARARLVAILGCVLLDAPASGDPPAKGAWGTAGPLLFQAADEQGRWVVACQAREDTDGDGKLEVGIGQHGAPYGDGMRTYVMRAGAEDVVVDELVAADEVGGHLVVLRDGQLELLGPRAGERVSLSALGADARDDDWRQYAHRAAAFDGAGTFLLWFHLDAQKVGSVRVRDLRSGVDAVGTVAPALTFRGLARQEAGWFELHSIAADTDGNGTLEWPSIGTSLSPRHCRGEPMSYSTFGGRGDRPAATFLSAAGGVTQALPGLQCFVGSRALCRRDDGALVLVDALGASTLALDASRQGIVVCHDPDLGVALVQDREGPEAGRYRFVRERGAAALDVDGPVVAARESTGRVPVRRRWSDIAGLERSLLELATGKLHRAEGSLVLKGRCVLLEQRSTLFLYDPRSGGLTRVAPAPPEPEETSPPLLRAGALVTYAGLVLDLEAGSVLGPLEPDALALDRSGRQLVPAGPVRRGLTTGPLRWVPTRSGATAGGEGASK